MSSERRKPWPVSIQPRLKDGVHVGHRVMWRDTAGKSRSRGFKLDELKAAEKLRRDIQRNGPEQHAELEAARAASDSPTLAQWTQHHIDHLTGVTPGTRHGYTKLAERAFLPRLGDFPIDGIDRDAIAKWVIWLSEQKTIRGTLTRPKTIANAHGLLSSIMESAVAAGHRQANPCHKMRLPKGTKFEGVFLTREEFNRLLDAIPEKHRDMVHMTANPGMRWGEVTAITWADVDPDAPVPTVRINKAWKRGPAGPVLGQPKSSKSNRLISLPPDVVARLRARRDDSPAEHPVFMGRPRGDSRTPAIHHTHWHPSVWKPAVAKAGVHPETRFHDLRHSHASWLIAEGVSLPYIQQRLGHESINTTINVYGHLSPDALTITARAIHAAIGQRADDILEGDVVDVLELEA